MFRSLNPGAIGVKVKDLAEGLELAARHGFGGYHFNLAEAAQLGVARVRELTQATGVRLAAWGFPVEFRGEEKVYQQGMEELPRLARVAVDLGVLRTATWITPCSDQLTYEENYAFHLRRLKPAAAILADHGIWFGLEYVSPRNSWTSKKYPFIHAMAQMRELAANVGTKVGFLLDSWHWYNAAETTGDLGRLRPEWVVDVHVNDAPAIPRGELVDNIRGLPGESGVIDLKGFLGTLKQIGYDGPVMVEPFSERVRQLPAEEACQVTAAALKKVWTQAGLSG